MNNKEATKLAKEIDATPGVTVTGFRRYGGGGDIAIDVQDTETGIPFVVGDREEWEERRKAATFYANMDNDARSDE